MDTSETYIKMIYEGWNDLEELWQPRRTDIVARYGTFDQVLYDFRAGDSVYEPMVIDLVEEDGRIRLFGWQTCFQGKHRLIPLFCQDQLQEIVGGDLWKLLDAFMEFIVWGKADYLAKFTSMEQLWLALVLHSLYKKQWDGEEWIK